MMTADRSSLQHHWWCWPAWRQNSKGVSDLRVHPAFHPASKPKCRGYVSEASKHWTLCPGGQNASEYFPEGQIPWLVASCRCYWERAWTVCSLDSSSRSDTPKLGRDLASQGSFLDMSKSCCVWYSWCLEHLRFTWILSFQRYSLFFLLSTVEL